MNDEPLKLITTKSDAGRAKELRLELEAALEPVCRVFDKIVDAGLTVTNFGIAPDYRKKHVVNIIKIMKEFP